MQIRRSAELIGFAAVGFVSQQLILNGPILDPYPPHELTIFAHFALFACGIVVFALLFETSKGLRDFFESGDRSVAGEVLVTAGAITSAHQGGVLLLGFDILIGAAILVRLTKWYYLELDGSLSTWSLKASWARFVDKVEGIGG